MKRGDEDGESERMKRKKVEDGGGESRWRKVGSIRVRRRVGGGGGKVYPPVPDFFGHGEKNGGWLDGVGE